MMNRIANQMPGFLKNSTTTSAVVLAISAILCDDCTSLRVSGKAHTWYAANAAITTASSTKTALQACATSIVFSR
jgi:hypothetical protein